MSVVFSGTNQGVFTSTGASQFINLPAGVDWMYTYNFTQFGVAGAGQTVQCYWQLGMPAGSGLEWIQTAVTNALTPGILPAGTGFTLANNTLNVPGPSVALTGITNANPPLVNTGSTAGLVDGDIVRIFATVGAQQLRGLDFTIGNITPNTSFELSYMAAIANANPGAGTYRRIPYNPYFYPSSRIISKISQAAQAIVTLTVTHSYVVGQSVRFIVPEVTATRFGMTELNGVEATIVAVGAADADGVTNTITINVDTTGFSAFAFTLTADPAFTPPQVIPVGEDTSTALALGYDILSDATVNQGEMGIVLAAGANSPAGVAADVIYWVAGKSFSGGM